MTPSASPVEVASSELVEAIRVHLRCCHAVREARREVQIDEALLRRELASDDKAKALAALVSAIAEEEGVML